MNARLPSETELARRFGASRPVVREALARLREDGVIVSRQGSGSYVKRRPDPAVLRFVPVGSIADVQRCFEFRAGLEGAAAALAAERWEDADIAEIRRALTGSTTASPTASSASTPTSRSIAPSRRPPTIRITSRYRRRCRRISPSA